MNDKDQFERTVRFLTSLQDVPGSDPVRQASARRALLERATRIRAGNSQRRRPGLWFHLRFAAASLSTILLAMAVISGVAYAADGARPGNALYAVDRFAEAVQLQLARDPERAVHLLLAHAGERLRESEQLAAAGSVGDLSRALDSYSQTLSTLGALLSASPAASARLGDLVEHTLAAHEVRLIAMSASVQSPAADALNRCLEAEQRIRENESAGSASSDPGPPAEKPGSGIGNGNADPNPPLGPAKPKDNKKHAPGNPHGLNEPGTGNDGGALQPKDPPDLGGAHPQSQL